MKRNLFFFSLLIGLTGILLGCVQGPGFEEEEQPNSNTKSLTDGIVAHRGNSGEFPENTIVAFRSAIYFGVDWVELDLRMTKDGKLVVIHDENTERVGGINLSVKESTYDELLTVDVATGFRERMGLEIYDLPPQKIPLLEDVLKLFLNQSRTKISIDLKDDIVEEAVRLVLNMEADHMVGFNNGNLNRMRTVKELAPQIPVFYSKRDVSEIEQDIMVAKEYGFESMMIHHASINAFLIEKVKSAELEIAAWTVNNSGKMKRLLLMGVERLFTDYPEVLIELKKEDPDL